MRTVSKVATTPPQESLGPEASQTSGNRATASSTSDSVLERNDELALRKLEQESLRSDKKDENDPSSDLPFLLEDFTDYLIPTEVHAPAHISFGTFYKGGNKDEEAQYFYSLGRHVVEGTGRPVTF